MGGKNQQCEFVYNGRLVEAGQAHWQSTTLWKWSGLPISVDCNVVSLQLPVGARVGGTPPNGLSRYRQHITRLLYLMIARFRPRRKIGGRKTAEGGHLRLNSWHSVR